MDKFNVTICGYDKQALMHKASKIMNLGFDTWLSVYKSFDFLKWKWQYKIDLERPIDPEPLRDIPKEKPKPVPRQEIMEIHCINNKTDKEYIVKSENDFGLTWD